MWLVETTNHAFSFGDRLVQQIFIIEGSQQRTSADVFGLKQMI
jgi:hypothetical protein